MNEELPLQNNENNQSIAEENEFLKLKMMLEHGATFGTMPDSPAIDPRVENAFLHSIMEFEKQYNDRKEITVFNKLRCPTKFEPVENIHPDKIDEAWEGLHNYLLEHGVELSVCSPNIDSRELYRFTTEELFDQKISDINMPGLMCSFIYDEFHPDHVYDNTRTAVEDCMQHILNKSSWDWMFQFADNGVHLNQDLSLSHAQFKEKILAFQASFSSMKSRDIKVLNCELLERTCKVYGTYEAVVTQSDDMLLLKGEWIVSFERSKHDFWEIKKLQIDGIKF